jgi:CxxC-x17-CxxC domain-containing protein
MEEETVEEKKEEIEAPEVEEKIEEEVPKEETTETTEEPKAEVTEEKSGFERKMYKATCADCRKECEVPFKPIEGRKIYCRDCYRKHGPQRRQRRRF